MTAVMVKKLQTYIFLPIEWNESVIFVTILNLDHAASGIGYKEIMDTRFFNPSISRFYLIYSYSNLVM